MRRTLLAALALIAVSCGGSTAVTTTIPAVTTTTGTTVVSTTAGSPTTTVAATTAPPTTMAETTTTRPRPEGEAAPDFTLELGEGGSFTLSEHHRPVFLLFWAEW